MKIILYFLVSTLFSLNIGEGYCQTYKALDFSFKDASRNLKNEEYAILIEKLNKLEITQNNISPIDKFLILNLYFKAYTGLSDYANSLKSHESMKQIVDSKENTFSSHPTVKQILITQETELKDLELIMSTNKRVSIINEETKSQNQGANEKDIREDTTTIKDDPTLKEEITTKNQGSNEKELTLFVSGQGKTLDEAKNIALRSALELAFGTFISSKTEIFNNELIGDEIVSLTSGNIQNYKINSQAMLPDGRYTVSLTATVSVSKFTSFVESQGIVVEFKGGLFAENIKIQKLNELAEYKAIINLCEISDNLLKKSLDFSLEVKTPTKSQDNIHDDFYDIDIAVSAITNSNYDSFQEYFYKTVQSLAMNQLDTSEYRRIKKNIYLLQVESNFKAFPEKFYFRNSYSALALQNLFFKSNQYLYSFRLNLIGLGFFDSKAENITLPLKLKSEDLYKITKWKMNTSNYRPMGFPNFSFYHKVNSTNYSSWEIFKMHLDHLPDSKIINELIARSNKYVYIASDFWSDNGENLFYNDVLYTYPGVDLSAFAREYNNTEVPIGKFYFENSTKYNYVNRVILSFKLNDLEKISSITVEPIN